MATAPANPTSAQVQASMQKIYLKNEALMKHTNWEWQLFSSKAGGYGATIALNTPYTFYFENATFYTKGLRLKVNNMKVDFATTTASGSAVGVNAGGLLAFLGTLRVKLGNDIYRVRASAIPLLVQTFMKNGFGYPFRGNTTRSYSYQLSGSSQGSSTSSNAVITSAGTTTINWYVDIPLAMLQSVYDPDGIAPTLSRAGLEVSFTTGNSLTGDDATLYPFYSTSGGTATLASSSPGTFSVSMLTATQNEVMSNKALPPFEVSSGFVVEENVYPLTATQRQFFTFQGQASNLWLTKSIVVINNPGQVAGAYSQNADLSYLALRYNKSKDIVVWNSENMSPGSPVPLDMFFIDQGEMYGDLPDGVLVFDWMAGTDPEYPNRHGYFDIGALRDAGIAFSTNATLKTGAEICFYNIYLVPDLYVVQG